MRATAGQSVRPGAARQQRIATQAVVDVVWASDVTAAEQGTARAAPTAVSKPPTMRVQQSCSGGSSWLEEQSVKAVAGTVGAVTETVAENVTETVQKVVDVKTRVLHGLAMKANLLDGVFATGFLLGYLIFLFVYWKWVSAYLY